MNSVIRKNHIITLSLKKKIALMTGDISHAILYEHFLSQELHNLSKDTELPNLRDVKENDN